MTVLDIAPEGVEVRPLAGIAWGPPPPFMSTLRSSPGPRPFVPRSDAQLYALPDDELVAYIVRAKRAGATKHAKTGMHMLLFKHENRMRRRVQNIVPAHLAHHSDTISDWVLERLFASALTLPLKGESVGEWVNWWKTVVNRQVVSFFRSSQGQALEKEQPWPTERVGGEGDGAAPDTIGKDFGIESLALSLDYRAAVDTALAGLNDKHRAIVEAAYFEDRPSKDVGDQFGESFTNVDQIKKRFRTDLRAALVARGVWTS